MSVHSLAVHHHPSARPNGRPPLLFVHGAYTNAQCWQLHFVPFFNQRGFDCYALDLSGHGESSGHDRIDDFGLDDYADDVARAVAGLPALPVLVGHSMGTQVVERYLTSGGQAAGVVLMAPVPPSGTGGSASRLALTRPDFFAELPNAVSGRPTEATFQVMTDIYFSPEMPHQELVEFLPMMERESDRAVAEMVALPFLRTGRRPAIPALVMGGGVDVVFPPSMLFFTTLAWRAQSVTVQGCGHMLMLDRPWPQAAEALAGWLETTFQARSSIT